MKQYQAPAGAMSISIAGESFDVAGDGVVSVPDHADHAQMLAHGYRQVGDVETAPPTDQADAVRDRDAAFNARVAEIKADFDARDARLNERSDNLSERSAQLDQRHAELNDRAAALDQRQADLDALAAVLAAKPADAVTAPPPPAPLPTTKPKR